ncbi:hypothetical protein F5888DRAFT_1798045 [Russula emetica]|nr:hypothetical protein F5888DRAFT_1798045 [Russula emetica]
MAHVTPTLASLRSKFWGKNSEEEAKEWRELHPIVNDDRTDDIGPGCYGLDLGIKFKCSKLWVRQDYIRAYNYCRERHEEGPSDETEMARSIVITGQPGIGKSYWITYAVRRRLGERKPFLWLRGSFCFLFVEDGVFERLVDHVSGGDFVPFLWAFVDADGRSGVPDNLAHETNLYIIFTTSPKRDRWKSLTKKTNYAVIIMNTWSLEEIHLAAAMHGFTNEQRNLAEGYFKNFGPTPRICIDFVQDPAQRVDHEYHCQAMISRLTSDRLRQFVVNGGDLDLDEFSHTIIMIRRNEIMSIINELQLLNRIDLFHTFASVNATKVVAGLAYESLCHTRLQEGIRLTLKPMVGRQERKLYHWKSPGEGQASNSMEVDDSEITEFFPSNTAVIYGSELTSVAPNRLYVPKSRTQVALDSFFQLDAMLHIFQFTVASSHDIKERIEKSLSGLLNILPPKTNWRFVFITPPGCEVDVTVASKAEKFLEGVTLYSAHSEIESRMNFAAPPEPD